MEREISKMLVQEAGRGYGGRGWEGNLVLWWQEMCTGKGWCIFYD